MMLVGRITKDEDGPFWAVEIETVGGHTQGRSRAEAFEMCADLIETMVNRTGFKVTVSEYGDEGAVLIESNDPSALAAYVLKYQREVRGLSLADVQKLTGASSRTAFKRYEDGESTPSIGRYYELLAAIAPDMAIIIGDRKPPKAASSSKGKRAAR